VILLTLLHLGIRNVRLGPSLPAFITPSLLKALVEQFNTIAIADPDDGLRELLGWSLRGEVNRTVAQRDDLALNRGLNPAQSHAKRARIGSLERDFL